MPGGGQLPMGGLTWVSTAATHRRQGLLTQLMARSLADIDRRGEPVAMLGASEGGDLRAIRIRDRDAAAGDVDRPAASPRSGPSSGRSPAACGSSTATQAFASRRGGLVALPSHPGRRGRPHRGVASIPLRRPSRSRAVSTARRSTSPIATATPSTGSRSSGTTASPAHNMRRRRARRDHRRRARRAVAHVAGRRPRRPDHVPRRFPSTIRCRTC